MNDRMEQEIRRTILRLQASMPEPRDRQTPVFTLLRIAAGEINGGLLLGLFAGAFRSAQRQGFVHADADDFLHRAHADAPAVPPVCARQ